MPPELDALYDRLAAQFVAQCVLPEGPWIDRVHHALVETLAVLTPHRDALRAVLPRLLDADEGLLSRSAFDSRRKVRAVFIEAVRGASNAPRDAETLGRLFYLLQVGVLLWWLLDRSDGQRTTRELIALLRSLGPAVSAALWLPGVAGILQRLNGLVDEGLTDDPEPTSV